MKRGATYIEDNVRAEVAKAQKLAALWISLMWTILIGWAVLTMVLPALELKGLPIMLALIALGISQVYGWSAKDLAKLAAPKVGDVCFLAATDESLSKLNGAIVRVTGVIEERGRVIKIAIEFQKVRWHECRSAVVWPEEVLPCEETFE